MKKILNQKQAKRWLKEAGKLALGYFRNVEPSLKDNHTYVTEADLKVQAYLVDKIDKYYPDIGVLVLGANSGKKGPGPLVTQLTKNAGSLPIPITIVPGELSKERLEAIT